MDLARIPLWATPEPTRLSASSYLNLKFGEAATRKTQRTSHHNSKEEGEVGGWDRPYVKSHAFHRAPKCNSLLCMLFYLVITRLLFSSLRIWGISLPTPLYLTPCKYQRAKRVGFVYWYTYAAALSAKILAEVLASLKRSSTMSRSSRDTASLPLVWARMSAGVSSCTT